MVISDLAELFFETNRTLQILRSQISRSEENYQKYVNTFKWENNKN